MGMGQAIAGRLGRKRQDESPSTSLLKINSRRTHIQAMDEDLASANPDTSKTVSKTATASSVERAPQRYPINFRIPFQKLAVTTATSQISSLVFCLAWSVKFNFYESTATHCRVDNYLPSLSATLDFTPQRDVWRACIGLSGLPRYFIAYLYYKLIYRSKVLLWFHWIEISALIGLSIVDSIRYFAFHATCVGIFLFTSIIHMTLVCNNHVRPQLAKVSETTRQKLKRTLVVKKRIAIINFVAIVTALYLYDRHNRYCEPGVYSMFSFLEYIVIVANVVYHLQAYYDLDEYSILVARAEQTTISAPTNASMIDKKSNPVDWVDRFSADRTKTD